VLCGVFWWEVWIKAWPIDKFFMTLEYFTDPNQLPPTVLSQCAKDFAFEQSLFVRLMQNRPDSVFLLDTQYRMHPEISRLPSMLFYRSALKDDPSVTSKSVAPWHHHRPNEFPPYCFIDVGTGRENRSNVGGSLRNEDEAGMAVQLFDQLCFKYPDIMVIVNCFLKKLNVHIYLLHYQTVCWFCRGHNAVS
jgi:superfamily I DNA and/or RNA helicase